MSILNKEEVKKELKNHGIKEADFERWVMVVGRIMDGKPVYKTPLGYMTLVEKSSKIKS